MQVMPWLDDTCHKEGDVMLFIVGTFGSFLVYVLYGACDSVNELFLLIKF